MRPISVRRSAAIAAAMAALVAVVALGAFLVLRDGEPGRTVMDDFESGALTGWQAVGSGNGGWVVYSDGRKAPDPARSDPNVPFLFPDPPQGRFAASTDPNGPGTRILYRDVRSSGRLAVLMNVFYAGSARVQQPEDARLGRPRCEPAVPGRPARPLGADRLRGRATTCW